MGTFISSLTQAIRQIDLTTPSWDVFILLFFLIGVFLYGIALGRNKVIIILLSLYFSLAIFEVSSFVRTLSTTFFHDNPFGALFTFFILFLLTFLVVGQSGAGRSLSNDAVGSFWQTIIFSILQVGLTISIALLLLPVSLLLRFSPTILNIFIDPLGQFLWLSLPIVCLIFTRTKSSALKV
ncbi:hypothetical protein A3I42_02480 [Candidatus Uhrbacteria bacterium RIFCSPLOWO2_02_FULL_49_11]|uniref:CvpA family protein n=1 Tax=Candidatus Uhrbacteria bacterium RIFCSPLOWO2_02_FULL_49_11 TaxID=1802409 RepID=A0A1F7VBD8_9BACT|nr:MAG: hypothetical protein A3I42_02480 [Candidatus Uhrbacteria bacterium RIFCSPLOWO2_02_FULL_49_11]